MNDVMMNPRFWYIRCVLDGYEPDEMGELLYEMYLTWWM